MKNSLLISIIIGCVLYLIYLYKYVAISPPTAIILKNPKYTVAEATSGYYNKKAFGKGNDFTFNYGKGIIRNAHQDREFVEGRKYLVVYDSINIRNGFLILDKYDITDSLIKYHINPDYKIYDVGWSLPQIPFKYDKSDIEYEVRMNLRSE